MNRLPIVQRFNGYPARIQDVELTSDMIRQALASDNGHHHKGGEYHSRPIHLVFGHLFHIQEAAVVDRLEALIREHSKNITLIQCEWFSQVEEGDLARFVAAAPHLKMLDVPAITSEGTNQVFQAIQDRSTLECLHVLSGKREIKEEVFHSIVKGFTSFTNPRRLFLGFSEFSNKSMSILVDGLLSLEGRCLESVFLENNGGLTDECLPKIIQLVRRLRPNISLGLKLCCSPSLFQNEGTSRQFAQALKERPLSSLWLCHVGISSASTALLFQAAENMKATRTMKPHHSSLQVRGNGIFPEVAFHQLVQSIPRMGVRSLVLNGLYNGPAGNQLDDEKEDLFLSALETNTTMHHVEFGYGTHRLSTKIRPILQRNRSLAALTERTLKRAKDVPRGAWPVAISRVSGHAQHQQHSSSLVYRILQSQMGDWTPVSQRSHHHHHGPPPLHPPQQQQNHQHPPDFLWDG